MAIEIGNTTTPEVEENDINIEEPVNVGTSNNDIPAPIKTQGLSSSEISDPNSIIVEIADKTTPIVVLYGPPSCGKTMTLVRMTRYLASVGFTVSPVKTFRPTSDSNYASLCENFDEMINSNNAAASTSNISFMLVKVSKNGKPICQILEAPGEYYFNPQQPDAAYPTYVNKIISSSNRKIWAIMVEPDWSDSAPRRHYVSRIKKLKTRMRASDKTVFIYNKIDMTDVVTDPGHIKVPLAIKSVEDLYPSIFEPFRNTSPLAFLGSKYNCGIVPFQTGDYTTSLNGMIFTEGPVEYPQMLWKELLKRING